MNEQQQIAMNSIAREILQLSRNTLMVNLRFLDAALSQFEYISCDIPTFMTDGHYLLFSPSHVLRSFKKGKEVPVRDYLHIVLHCIYRHMFVSGKINQPLWDLACDIAVENTIMELNLPSTATRQTQQEAILHALAKELKAVTAESIYRYYMDEMLASDQISSLRELFYADDHELWYRPPEERASAFGIDILKTRNGADSAIVLEHVWKDISEHIQQDLVTFSRKQGDKAGALSQNLKEVNRERYNYEAFLRKFAVKREEMKTNPDEFDYIFYTYGLQMYKNMPLIEPLEYREVSRIREFVIAIDTSGSVRGDLVQSFVQKTYNILKSTESFFTTINLHIMQCDEKIQQDIKITNQKEFDAYLKSMKLMGLGGTDFRPVFQRVDEMVRAKEFINLRGLIYFTDGYGTFPERKPNYDVAFIFVDNADNNFNVPPWAIKLVLKKNEI